MHYRLRRVEQFFQPNPARYVAREHEFENEDSSARRRLANVRRRETTRMEREQNHLNHEHAEEQERRERRDQHADMEELEEPREED